MLPARSSRDAEGPRTAVQPEVLRGLLAAARLHFPDLELTAPSGVLSVAAPPGPIDQIRIEAGPSGVLRLQSVGLVAADRSDVSRRASVEVSGAGVAGGRRGDMRGYRQPCRNVGTCQAVGGSR